MKLLSRWTNFKKSLFQSLFSKNSCNIRYSLLLLADTLSANDDDDDNDNDNDDDNIMIITTTTVTIKVVCS